MKRMFSSIYCLILFAALAGFAMVSTTMADAPSALDAEIVFMSDPGFDEVATVTPIDPVLTDANFYATDSQTLSDNPNATDADSVSYADLPTGQGVTPWRSGKRLTADLTSHADTYRLFRMRT